MVDNYNTVLQITGFMNKPKKDGGTFPVFQTSQGDLSCFEDDVVESLTPKIGSFVDVEITTRPNGYKNITKFIRDAQEIEAPSQTPAQAPIEANNNWAYKAPAQATTSEQVSRVIHEIIDNSCKNSFEFGKAGERGKIYFKDGLDFERKYKDIMERKAKIDAEIYGKVSVPVKDAPTGTAKTPIPQMGEVETTRMSAVKK